MSGSLNHSSGAPKKSETPAVGGDPARGPGLFEALGVEIEFMIVDGQTLDVKPIADRLLSAEGGPGASDVVFPDVSWSNELINHVIELKTTGPVRDLSGEAARFQAHVERVHQRLAPMGARLMPGGMHPWMDPEREGRLWPHGGGEIYEAFDRVFDCSGHGWANLQSLHLNLPFQGDEEFGRLHAAVRMLLPILPALSASSPFVDGQHSGELDHRLTVYRANCTLVPQCAGRVIPEAVFTIDQYQSEILEKIYAGLRPHDPDGMLQEEWANARGAIARFHRNTIEIRTIDAQECPAADLAVAAAAVSVLKRLAHEEWSSWGEQKRFTVDSLVAIFDATIREGERAMIEDAGYLRALGWTQGPVTAGRLWGSLIQSAEDLDEYQEPLGVIQASGPLARRLSLAVGAPATRKKLFEVYRELCECCREGRLFRTR